MPHAISQVSAEEYKKFTANSLCMDFSEIYFKPVSSSSSSSPSHIPVAPDTGQDQRSVSHVVQSHHICTSLNKDLYALQETFSSSHVQWGPPWICFTGSHSLKKHTKSSFRIYFSIRIIIIITTSLMQQNLKLTSSHGNHYSTVVHHAGLHVFVFSWSKDAPKSQAATCWHQPRAPAGIWGTERCWVSSGRTGPRGEAGVPQNRCCWLTLGWTQLDAEWWPVGHKGRPCVTLGDPEIPK